MEKQENHQISKSGSSKSSNIVSKEIGDVLENDKETLLKKNRWLYFCSYKTADPSVGISKSGWGIDNIVRFVSDK